MLFNPSGAGAETAMSATRSARANGLIGRRSLELMKRDSSTLSVVLRE